MASNYIQLPPTTSPDGEVNSFNGRTGVVVPESGDYTASQVTFVPAGSIAATDVQTAIEEVASEAGNVVGPASATDSALALFDGTTGKFLKNSSVTVSGSTITGNLTGTASVATALAATLAATAGGTGLTTYATGDMLYASATNTLAKQAIGSQAQIQRVVSGIPAWRDQIDPSLLIYFYEDFITPVANFNSANSGSGSISGIRSTASTNQHVGTWRLATGTATNGYGNLFGSNVDDMIKLGGGEAVFETSVNLSALSDGTNTYSAFVGLVKGAYNNVLPASDGIYFFADSNANANWRLRSQASGSTTDRDTGIAIATGWVKLTWVLNSAGNSVQAYINGVAAGSPITTNIPTAALLFQAMILKAAGITAVNFDVDYFKLMITLATAR